MKKPIRTLSPHMLVEWPHSERGTCREKSWSTRFIAWPSGDFSSSSSPRVSSKSLAGSVSNLRTRTPISHGATEAGSTQRQTRNMSGIDRSHKFEYGRLNAPSRIASIDSGLDNSQYQGVDVQRPTRETQCGDDRRNPPPQSILYHTPAGNYGTRTESMSKPLHPTLPTLDDDALTLLAKLNQIESHLEHGGSLTTPVHSQTTTSQQSSVEVARSRMAPRESESWLAYLKGSVTLPELDWDANHGDLPTSKKALKKARRRAEALNRLYDSDRAQPSHSAWFTSHHPECLPLVKAMARVIGAEKQSSTDHTRDISTESDLQALRSIISVSSQHQLTSKTLSKRIDTRIQLLQRRVKQYRHNLPKPTAKSPTAFVIDPPEPGNGSEDAQSREILPRDRPKDTVSIKIGQTSLGKAC